jgi:hypothetical protein
MRTALRFTVALMVAGLAVALLAGCGSDEPEATPAEQETTSEPTDETSKPTPEEPSPSETFPPGPIEYTAIALVSASNAEGTVSPRAIVLDSQEAVGKFAGQFGGDQMGRALAREYARADLPKDEVMLGAVVDVSCEAPSALQVEKTKRGVEVTATAKASKNVQCLVPVTTVALVSVPEAAV